MVGFNLCKIPSEIEYGKQRRHAAFEDAWIPAILVHDDGSGVMLQLGEETKHLTSEEVHVNRRFIARFQPPWGPL